MAHCSCPFGGGVILSGFLLVSSLSPVHADEILETVRAGNTSALQSIRSFSCRVTVIETGSEEPGQSRSYSGDYWRSGGRIRCRYEENGRSTAQILQNGDRRVSLVRGLAGMSTNGGITQASDGRFGDCDVWMFGLLTFVGPDDNLLSFDSLLDKPHTIQAVRRETEGSTVLMYVDLEHELSRLEFWFDPQVNFLVRRHTVTAKQSSMRSELEVKHFKEVAAGVFFPEKVETRSFYGAQSLPSRTVEFKDIRVNQPIAAGVFQLRFPAGTKVTDYIRGKVYKVDENGAPVGPMQDIVRLPPATKTNTASRTETREEPEPLSSWILPVSVGILVLAGVLWLARKWKQRYASIPPGPR